VFVENHGILFGIDIVQYSVNLSLKLCLIQMHVGRAYTIVELAGLNVVPYRKLRAKSQ
jgi:hypothetical protein